MSHTAPDVIPLALVDFNERGRTTYSRIEELADSIFDNGLIQPIVLTYNPATSRYDLVAGGRRTTALISLGVTELHHGITSEPGANGVPGRCGYLLKGETTSGVLSNLLSEIAENLDRENLPWQDELTLIVKAWRLAEREAHSHSKSLLMRDFGAMLGVGYSCVQNAVLIHDDVKANPERYAAVTSIRAAYAQVFKNLDKQATEILASRSITKAPAVAVLGESKPEKPAVTVDLSRRFLWVNSYEYMQNLPAEYFHHIVCDPDYAVSVEDLSATSDNMAAGVVQSSVAESVNHLRDFLFEAARLIKPGGFCVFFYDMNHHEKAVAMATAVGFNVQRWPLIWHKTDHRANGSPQSNFCKNMEYALVCRTPGAVLSKAQMTSIFSCPTGEVTKHLNHPFAKPAALWQWIYSAISHPGQLVYDPFLGSGSSVIGALRCGLVPYGSEITPAHYHNAVLNIQREYKLQLGPNVTFH